MSSVKAIDGNFSPGCEIMSENKEETEAQRAQSTPGPWFWDPDQAYCLPPYGYVIYAENSGGRTAICEPNRPKTPEGAANAILIAAAPELRKRLAELVRFFEGLGWAGSREWHDAKTLLNRIPNEGA